MEFLQGNIAVQIAMLAVGLGLIGVFGWRTIQKHKKSNRKGR